MLFITLKQAEEETTDRLRSSHPCFGPVPDVLQQRERERASEGGSIWGQIFPWQDPRDAAEGRVQPVKERLRARQSISGLHLHNKWSSHGFSSSCTPLIHSSAHAEVRSRRRGEKKRERRRGQPFCWSCPPWQKQHTLSHLCCCCRIQLRSYKLICFGKFAAAFTQKVVYERKSQSRARTITEMIRFNANALENMSKCCLFHCKCKIFGAIYLEILSNITCF